MTVVGFPENPLLVPISIEALVVETENETGSDLSVDFSRLFQGKILGSDISPSLFQFSKKCNYGLGVHLHWALPAAYRHGGSVLAQARRKAKAHDVLAQRQAATPDAAERNRLAKRMAELWKRLDALVRKLYDQGVVPTADVLAVDQAAALKQLSATSDADERQRLAKRLSSLGMKLADLVEQKSQDELRFPVIPNRWLVQRMYRDANTQKMVVRAWVVESDYRYSYNPDKDTYFDGKSDRPITVPIFDAMPLFDYVGKSFDFPGWKEEPHPRVELTALGYGDPAFAAYYPACKSVLGFHDSLQDVESSTALTYMVVGWHADPAKDILQYFDIEELGWSCKAPADADSYPEHVLCHGSIYDMQWKNKTLAGAQENRYASKIPSLTAKNCQIAIGNTSAEGLAALLAEKLNKPRLENLLTAFNDDLLTKDADYREIEAQLHQHRFGSAAGGGQFFIDMKQAETEQSLSATDATLPSELQEALAALNKLQQKCDARERELTEARWALYATWCKWVTKYIAAGYAEEPADITSTLEAELEAEKSRVLAEMQTLANDRDRLAQQRDDIVKTVKQRFHDLEFVKSAAPPFWHANDPVVFISAPGLSPSSESRRAQRNSEGGPLICRMTGQEITAMCLDIPDGQKDIAVRADRVFTLDTALRDQLKLPDGIFKLLYETWLLDFANAEAIAGAAYVEAGLLTAVKIEELVETIKVLQRPKHSEPGITQALPTAAEIPRLTGTIPDLLALRDWDGNPWLPLFIQWEVAWESSYTSLDKALEHWQLVNEDGKPRADGEFHWDGTTPTKFPNIYSGYGILSPHATWNLEERLEKYNADKHEPVLDQVITQLGYMNVLGLSLGGLHNGFIMRDQIIRPRPINPRIFGQDTPLDPKDPISEFLTGSISRLSPGFDKPFFPLRAGHLKLTRLSIVDTFGQTLDVPMEQLILASSVSTPGTKQLIQLSPRFAQPLRLRFDWEPAKNPAETLPVDSPVCGWVIPNHLDKNLLFYDASGTPLGVLQKILSLTAEGAKGGVPNTDAKAFAKAFFWVPMPGTEHKPESIINPELKYFVDFLQDMGADNGNNFWSLLDAALANTDPGEPEQDSLLAVLLGRPLALVRATVQLELDGLAATDQHLAKIGEPVAVADDFTKIKFPLCLGDAANSRDGLVGFFLHDSKGEVIKPFYAAAGAEEVPGLPVENLIEYKHSHDILDCATPVALTLLMDPRTRVHLTTGILPKRFVELPSRVSSAAQSAKEAFFQVAPLISPGNVGSGGDVSMPKPSDDFGKWSWAYRPQVTMWQEAKEIIASSDRGSFHPRPQEISEGWLKLKMNPVAILSFWVKEGMQEVAMNTNITLAWVLQGGDRLTLLANGDDKNPIRVWDTAPLPEQYAVQVQSEITYTLILFNKDNNRAEKRITIRIAKGINHGE